jgi:hypothetical protein
VSGSSPPEIGCLAPPGSSSDIAGVIYTAYDVTGA